MASKKDPPQESSKAVTDRWWVDTDRKRREPLKRPATPIGSALFQAAEGYDQDRAHGHLTDTNLKLLRESDPPERGWGYLQLAESAFPEQRREQIKRLVDLPPYARGAVIDSGESVRLLITGRVLGERILELTLGEVPSFDCWLEGDWVYEALYENAEQAIAALREHIREYLAPESIARWRELRAQP